jgi:hypothetical protein
MHRPDSLANPHLHQSLVRQLNMSPNFNALCYLHAFDHRLPTQNGLAFESLLRTYRLDYSVNSLARIDDFLDELRIGKKIDEATYLDDTAVQNLLYLLNFYVGEVIARSLKSQPHWYAFNDVLDIDPMSKMSGPTFENSVTLGFPHHAIAAAKPWFRPLISITSRLFSEHVEKSVLFSAGIMLPPEYQDGDASEQPLPPLSIPPWTTDVAAQIVQSPELLNEVRMTAPPWAKEDALGALFDNQANILAEGRIVWAAIVQANSSLFKPKTDGGAPFEVLYDPQGRLPREDLAALAQNVFALKERRPSNPTLVPLHEHLKNEFTRALGLDVPTTFVPYPLKVSSTYFERKNFPYRRLAQNTIPVLISDTQPGLVMPLPSKFWPVALLAEWAAKPGEYIQDPALAHLNPASITEEGLLWFRQKDYDRARAAWEIGAESDNAGAINGLAMLYERGLGVAENRERALALYERAAKKNYAGAVAAIARLKGPRATNTAAATAAQDAGKRDVKSALELADRILAGEKKEQFRPSKLNVPFFMIILGLSAMAFSAIYTPPSKMVTAGILISGAICCLIGLYRAFKAIAR